MANNSRIFKYKLALYLFIVVCVRLQAQDSIEKLRMIRDSSLGIVISQQKFDSVADSLLVKFGSDSTEKKIDDYLQLIRVGNTIAFNVHSDTAKKYKDLLNLYLFKYMNKIAKLTDASISVGFSYYSRKYDIQIGGIKTKNNFYKIVH